MKILKRSLVLTLVITFSLVQWSCDDNESGIEFVGFEARFVSDVNNNVITFTNLSNEATSFEWDFGDGTFSTVANPTKVYDEGGTFTVTLTASNENNQTDTFQDTFIIEDLFDGGLLVNGDFENGSEGWIQGVDDNNPAPVVTEDGNSFYEVNITNPDPNQPFLVNLSQKLPIEQGNTYVLTFDAWSDTNRTLIAGIGLSGGDFSNDVQTVNLTDTQQTFELTLSSQDFGAPDARVLFDSNGDAGLVRIDNVSLKLQ
ncbi:PKD domain-containing protein [Flavobacteriaceae bacterium 14752]|uniref:PKD domain-containing protein n=1 Tax=Mesohalobacter salilacus TaxID=2491711 RepID=UPI000F62E2BD|nr:PKD domain-containing protein [Flavobacteriaceae bacterium 14752]